MPSFLFCEFYLSLLFKFKIGLSLSLSCLISSMFIVIRITIRKIKTKCFENTILMAESPLKVGGTILPITFPILVTFTRFLVRTFRKVCSTSTLKIFCHSSYFLNYNRSPNEQIFSLIDAQVHL